VEWRIYPVDVLFFRGMEPMNAGEAAVVSSQFPPSPEVMQGFVRANLLMTLGVAFDDYRLAALRRGGSQAAQNALDLLGGPNGLGRLDLRGPYLIQQRGEGVERWYPAPLDLYRGADGDWERATPAAPVECDLGTVALLAPPDGETAAGRWISSHGLQRYLAGQQIPQRLVVGADTLYAEERRVGIARDPTTRVSREGMIYAPVFVRLDDRESGGLRPAGIGVRVRGIPEELQLLCGGLSRLGGEGRLAEVEIHPEVDLPPAAGSGDGRRLLLLTPARWGGSWLPPGFEPRNEEWHGWLHGAAVTLVSAAVDRPRRFGGLDMVGGRPKDAEACVPAGSVYYIRAGAGTDLGDWHDQTLGARGQAGFGQIVVGVW